MANPVQAAFNRPPSEADRMVVVHGPGGRVYQFPTLESDVAAAEQRAAHAAAHAAMQVQRDREAEIAGRVKACVQAGPGGTPGATARDRLSIHIAWVERARRQAAAAGNRALECAAAASRHDAAKLELTTIQGEVRASFAEWVQFGAEDPQPPTRLAKQHALQATILEIEPVAQVADAATLESQIAQAAVDGLQAMLPVRRAEVLREEAAPSVCAGIRAAVAELQAGLSALAAMDQATMSDSYEARATLNALGVAMPPRFLPERGHTKVSIPGQEPFTVAPDPVALERFAGMLWRLQRDPAADLSEPPPPEPPAPPRKPWNPLARLKG
jgi:hypothetical protein